MKSNNNDKVSDKQCVRCGEPASFTIKNPATTLYYCHEHYFQEPSVKQAPTNPSDDPRVCPYCPPMMAQKSTPGATLAFQSWHKAGHPKAPSDDSMGLGTKIREAIAQYEVAGGDPEFYIVSKSWHDKNWKESLDHALTNQLKALMGEKKTYAYISNDPVEAVPISAFEKALNKLEGKEE